VAPIDGGCIMYPSTASWNSDQQDEEGEYHPEKRDEQTVDYQGG
jgi:hypothetical protein